jgi:hypothetical protein
MNIYPIIYTREIMGETLSPLYELVFATYEPEFQVMSHFFQHIPFSKKVTHD